MKWPSSRASAARNSARISSSVIPGALGRGTRPFNTCPEGGLRLCKPRPIEPADQRRRVRVLDPYRMATGVKMRLIGWAIALAAAGMTPAAAQAPASSPASTEAAHDHMSAAAPAATAATPPAGTAQNPGQPDAAQPAVVPGTVGHMIPTPGVGEPD